MGIFDNIQDVFTALQPLHVQGHSLLVWTLIPRNDGYWQTDEQAQTVLVAAMVVMCSVT